MQHLEKISTCGEIDHLGFACKTWGEFIDVHLLLALGAFIGSLIRRD